MKTGYKKQRPPFQAVSYLLQLRLVDEKHFLSILLERALWVRALWLCQPMEGTTRGTHRGLTALI